MRGVVLLSAAAAAVIVTGCTVSIDDAGGAAPDATAVSVPVAEAADVDISSSTVSPTAVTTTNAPSTTTTDVLPSTVPSTTTTAATTTTSTATTTTTTTTTTTRSTIPPAVVEASRRLGELRIAEPEPDREPYERDRYDGEGWEDVDDDCVSTRHELLAAASLIAPTMTPDGCSVFDGLWSDPYTGVEYTSANQVSIDHLVPLAEAHRSGAWQWDDTSKVAFSNDETPGHLVVVGRSANQAKADSTPDEWLPPDPTFHCQYAIDWTTSKARYGLTVTMPEAQALATALATCDSAPVVRPVDDAPTPVVVITAPTTTTTTTLVVSTGPGILELVSCDRRAEIVTIANVGGEPMSLSGFRLHDEGDKHSTNLDGFGMLGPGDQLRILTGDDAAPGDGQVVWKRQNVWNNDGDTAHLIGFGVEQTSRC